MRFFFDARYIRTDFHDSMSRCSSELGAALAKITPVTFIISDTKQLALLPSGADYIQLHPVTSAREPLTAMILNTYRPDVVFTPMQMMGTMGRRFKVILTLHDLIYYHHRTPPANLSRAIRLGWRLYHTTYLPQRITLNQADMVATVSQASKAEIVKARLTKRPIVVIPNAPRDLAQFLKTPVRLDQPPRDLVYMGSFMRYKNVEALIAAMEFLPDHTVHLLSPITPKRRGELERGIPKNAKVVFHNGVSDQAYAKLLANNAVLVSATRHEGFCLPLAEALALGVPAVVSDLPVLHEVGGNGALYFNCNQPQEFARQVLRLDDSRLRKKVSEAGKRQMRQFNWEDSARTLLEAAQSLTQPK